MRAAVFLVAAVLATVSPCACQEFNLRYNRSFSTNFSLSLSKSETSDPASPADFTTNFEGRGSIHYRHSPNDAAQLTRFTGVRDASFSGTKQHIDVAVLHLISTNRSYVIDYSDKHGPPICNFADPDQKAAHQFNGFADFTEMIKIQMQADDAPFNAPVARTGPCPRCGPYDVKCECYRYNGTERCVPHHHHHNHEKCDVYTSSKSASYSYDDGSSSMYMDYRVGEGGVPGYWKSSATGSSSTTVSGGPSPTYQKERSEYVVTASFFGTTFDLFEEQEVTTPDDSIFALPSYCKGGKERDVRWSWVATGDTEKYNATFQCPEQSGNATVMASLPHTQGMGQSVSSCNQRHPHYYPDGGMDDEVIAFETFFCDVGTTTATAADGHTQTQTLTARVRSTVDEFESPKAMCSPEDDEDGSVQCWNGTTVTTGCSIITDPGLYSVVGPVWERAYAKASCCFV